MSITEFLIITPETITHSSPISTFCSIIVFDPIIEFLPILTFFPTKTLFPNFTVLYLALVKGLSYMSG